MADREVTGWLVIMRFKPESVVVRPQPGVEWYATIANPAPLYHRMTANPVNHTLIPWPSCLTDDQDLDLRVGGVAALEEATAALLGATRCPNCTWGAA